MKHNSYPCFSMKNKVVRATRMEV